MNILSAIAHGFCTDLFTNDEKFTKGNVMMENVFYNFQLDKLSNDFFYANEFTSMYLLMG